MNYVLRSVEELQKEWNNLKAKEAALHDYLRMELSYIAADKSVIETELKLLKTLGKI